ncbi:ferric-chelate reductase 1-like isoform X2 [Dreissena polymorpha]|uniref:ferric-chelate reductase 1-like isoform X2 n=1 Tax=Dreissena polymorpha TaxID=45954 RepID=UPI002264C528|nr:ferric-chelate reductase 1-like isoform X2 [Dreissena polymorpha]
MDYLFLITILLGAMTYHVTGYPTGAPIVACEQMRPYHPPTTTTGEPPFAIKITQTFYKPGSEIKGTIYSPTGVLFRGFLIEARLQDASSTDPYGTFSVIDSNTQTQCGMGSKQGLTHVSNTNKTSVNFSWTAPPASVGDINFRLTVVESYNVSRYWLRIFSAVLEDCAKHIDNPGCDGHTTPPNTGSTPPSNQSTESTQHMTTTTQELTTTAGSKIPYDAQCGKTIGCFPKCPSGCDFLVSWQPPLTNRNGDIQFDIKMMVQQTTSLWVAVGLSKTGKMDKTSVAACVTNEAQAVDILSSHNVDHQNIPYTNPKLGLTLIHSSVSGSEISCSYVRQRSANDSNFWDLSELLYLVVGTGPFLQGALQPHSSIPVVSKYRVNFSEASVPNTGDTTSSLVKLHASLMVIAWVFFSSVGVLVARHCKSLVESETMCGVKYWFAIHRSFMLCAALCVIIAFVVIFIEVGGYSQVAAAPGKAFTKAHPILGIIVTALTVLNPLMALIRPAPDGEYRFLFNWAHFLVGTSAHILAVITIFIGVNITKANVNSNVAMAVMGVYVGVFVLVHLAMEIYNKRQSSVKSGYIKFNNMADSSSTTISLQMRSIYYSIHQNDNNRSIKTSGSSVNVQKVESNTPFLQRVLVIHVLLMAVAAFVMVYLIASATQTDQL